MVIEGCVYGMKKEASYGESQQDSRSADSSFALRRSVS
jgi:hypothetical protein